MRKNLSVMGMANLGAFLMNFLSVVVVSRLLTPQEIGIYSVSVAVLGIAHIFRDFGVGQYLVQAKVVGQEEFRAAFSVTLFSSWLLAILLFLAGAPLSELYEHQGVAEVLAILCVNFLILPFGTPLLSLMQRELQFKLLAFNMWMSTFVQTSVTIACAYAGQGYLSMAWGALASHAVKVLWLNAIRPGEIFMWPTFKGLGETVRFGSLSSLASIIKEVGTGAPDLILGKTLGFVEVAFLSRAAGLKKMLITRLVGFIRSVYFPTFASELRKGRDGAAMYSQAMLYMVAITGPVLAVLAVVSEPLILFLFGAQWERSAPLASLICFYGMLVTPYSLYSLSLIAAGQVGRNLWVESSIQIVQVLVLLSSIWLPLEQVVWLFGLVALVQMVSSQYAMNKTFGLTALAHLRAISSSLVLIPTSVVGPAMVMLLAQTFGYSNWYFVILLFSGLTAAIGWGIGVYLTNHVMLKELKNVLALLRSKYKQRFGSKEAG
ncbi:oligosaccharide flippase family protein [Aliiglaciecola sp. CAU 1673]|uniref:oligosaccharide flippase family protein n=1 Tax=Aliiglaciecola sp. CAU 1673 TaxID=3032595 RepID=UPI0023DCAE7D|nr:oligosaccharide flippase family protein [Aliiglaciecola sp. CAU 1673]MDF2177294.1 oligosaccharide flippase family protein [Aliiglaciecola sp. CAU 1673]